MLDVATGMHYISEKGLVHRVSLNINYGYWYMQACMMYFNSKLILILIGLGSTQCYGEWG